MKIRFTHSFDDIINVENLLDAWKEFIRGKRQKRDVQEFQLHLMDNILSVYEDLANHRYQHGGYHAFNISDPKPRQIHKARVRDRLVHHALYRKLYPFFDRTFIADSFFCRRGKGTHRALNRCRAFGRIVSKNKTRTCWVLKCDIRKFFANIDHQILLRILRGYITDADLMGLLEEVVGSFSSIRPGVGLPLGNLTSQLLVNIYMNEFDRFVKHRLKARQYVRYADDFVLFSDNRQTLEEYLPKIRASLHSELKLELHQQKVSIATLSSGIDFLGWVHFPDHRVLRTATKRRMMRRLENLQKTETLQSYLGLLKHGNAYNIRRSLRF